uniref:Uncharacterized protein n=1 Tax=Magallana gigas TaxID=29159 RepID=K1PI53_MAGGI
MAVSTRVYVAVLFVMIHVYVGHRVTGCGDETWLENFMPGEAKPTKYHPVPCHMECHSCLRVE